MSQTDSTTDPVYAQLTAPGRGAVASILISGTDLPARLGGLFRPASGRELSRCFSLDIIYGRWFDQETPGEDLIVCPLTDSFAEIHCHAGDAAVSAIVKSLEAHGFRAATAHEISEIRQVSPWQFDTEQALQSATTERTSLLLLELLNSIDDSIEYLANLIGSEPRNAVKQLNEILKRREFGIHLTEPWKVVLCGKPNVGKSSLINAIVGFDRVIVHETAGTTRDVVEQLTAIDGWPVQLKDTAGLRVSSDEIEVQGVRKARHEIQNADLVLLVTDATENEQPDAEVLEQKPGACLVVVNKSDLVANRVPVPNEIWTSATTGHGLDKLVNEIGIRLVFNPQTDQLFPINASQVATFERVLDLIDVGDFGQAVQCLRLRTR